MSDSKINSGGSTKEISNYNFEAETPPQRADIREGALFLPPALYETKRPDYVANFYTDRTNYMAQMQNNIMRGTGPQLLSIIPQTFLKLPFVTDIVLFLFTAPRNAYEKATIPNRKVAYHRNPNSNEYSLLEIHQFELFTEDKLILIKPGVWAKMELDHSKLESSAEIQKQIDEIHQILGEGAEKGENNEIVKRVCDKIIEQLQEAYFKARSKESENCFFEEYDVEINEMLPAKAKFCFADEKVRLLFQYEQGNEVGYEFDMSKPIDPSWAPHALNFLEVIKECAIKNGESLPKYAEIHEFLTNTSKYSIYYRRVKNKFFGGDKVMTLKGIENQIIVQEGDGKNTKVLLDVDLTNTNLTKEEITNALKILSTWIANDEAYDSEMSEAYPTQAERDYQRISKALKSLHQYNSGEKAGEPAYFSYPLFPKGETISGDISHKEAVMNAAKGVGEPSSFEIKKIGFWGAKDIGFYQQGSIVSLRIDKKVPLVVNMANGLTSNSDINEALNRLRDIKKNVRDNSEMQACSNMETELLRWRNQGIRLLYNSVPFGNDKEATEILDFSSNSEVVATERLQNLLVQSSFSLKNQSFQQIESKKKMQAFLRLDRSGNNNHVIDLIEINTEAILELFRLKYEEPMVYEQVKSLLSSRAAHVFDFIDEQNNNATGQDPNGIASWSELRITVSGATKDFKEYFMMSKEEKAVVDPFIAPDLKRVSGHIAISNDVIEYMKPRDDDPKLEISNRSVNYNALDRIASSPLIRNPRESQSYFDGEDHQIYSNFYHEVTLTNGKIVRVSYINGRELQLDVLKVNKKTGEVQVDGDQTTNLDVRPPFPLTGRSPKFDIEKKNKAENIFSEFDRLINHFNNPDITLAHYSKEFQSIQEIQFALEKFEVSRPESFEHNPSLGQFVLEVGNRILWIKKNGNSIDSIRGFSGNTQKDPDFSIYVKGSYLSPNERYQAFNFVEKMQEDFAKKGQTPKVLIETIRSLKKPYQWTQTYDHENEQDLAYRTAIIRDEKGNYKKDIRLEVSRSIDGPQVLTHVHIIVWGRVSRDIEFTLGNGQGENIPEDILSLLYEWYHSRLSGDEVWAEERSTYQEIINKINYLREDPSADREDNFLRNVNKRVREFGVVAANLRKYEEDYVSAGRISLIQARLYLINGKDEDKGAWLNEAIKSCHWAWQDLNGDYYLDHPEELKRSQLNPELREGLILSAFYEGIFQIMMADVPEGDLALSIQKAKGALRRLRALDVSGDYTDRLSDALAGSELEEILTQALAQSKDNPQRHIDRSQLIELFLTNLSVHTLDESNFLARDIIFQDLTPEQGLEWELNNQKNTSAILSNETRSSKGGLLYRKRFFSKEESGLRLLLELRDIYGDILKSSSDYTREDFPNLDSLYEATLFEVSSELHKDSPNQNVVDALLRQRNPLIFGKKATLIEEAYFGLQRFEFTILNSDPKGLGKNILKRDYLFRVQKLRRDLSPYLLEFQSDLLPDQTLIHCLNEELKRIGEDINRGDQPNFQWEGGQFVQYEGRCIDKFANHYTNEIQGILKQHGVPSPFYDEERLTNEIMDFATSILSQNTSTLDKAKQICDTIYSRNGGEDLLFKAYQTLIILARYDFHGIPQIYLEYSSDPLEKPKLGLGVWVNEGEKRGFYTLSSNPQQPKTITLLNNREAWSRFVTHRADDRLEKGFNQNSRFQAKKYYEIASQIDSKNMAALWGLTRAYLAENTADCRKMALDELQRYFNWAALHTSKMGRYERAQIRVMMASIYLQAGKKTAALKELNFAQNIDSSQNEIRNLISEIESSPRDRLPLLQLTEVRRRQSLKELHFSMDSTFDDFLEVTRKSYPEIFRRVQSNEKGLFSHTLGEHSWQSLREILSVYLKNYLQRTAKIRGKENFDGNFELTPQALYNLPPEFIISFYDLCTGLGLKPEFCVRGLNPQVHEAGRLHINSDLQLSVRFSIPGIDQNEEIYFEDLFEDSYQYVESRRNSLEMIGRDWSQSEEIDNALSYVLVEIEGDEALFQAMDLDDNDGVIDNVKTMERYIDRFLIDEDSSGSKERLNELQHFGILLGWQFDADSGSPENYQLIRALEIEIGKVYQEAEIEVLDWDVDMQTGASIIDLIPNRFKGHWQKGLIFQQKAEEIRGHDQSSLYESMRLYFNAKSEFQEAARFLKESGRHGTLGPMVSLQIAAITDHLAKISLQLQNDVQADLHLKETFRNYIDSFEMILKSAENENVRPLAKDTFAGLAILFSSILTGRRSLDQKSLKRITTEIESLLNQISEDHFFHDLYTYRAQEQYQITDGVTPGLADLALLFTEAAKQLDPDDFDMQVNRAHLLRYFNASKHALCELKLCLKGNLTSSQRAQTYIQLGDIEREMVQMGEGDLEQALKYFFLAIEEGTETNTAVALQRIFEVYEILGREDKEAFIEVFDRLEAMDHNLFSNEVRRYIRFQQAVNVCQWGGAPLWYVDQICGNVMYQETKVFLEFLLSLVPGEKEEKRIKEVLFLLKQEKENPKKLLMNEDLFRYVYNNIVSLLPDEIKSHPNTLSFLSSSQQVFFRSGQVHQRQMDSQTAKTLFQNSLVAISNGSDRQETPLLILTGKGIQGQNMMTSSINKGVPSPKRSAELLLKYFASGNENNFREFYEISLYLVDALLQSGDLREAKFSSQVLIEFNNRIENGNQDLRAISKFVDISSEYFSESGDVSWLQEASVILGGNRKLEEEWKQSHETQLYKEKGPIGVIDLIHENINNFEITSPDFLSGLYELKAKILFKTGDRLGAGLAKDLDAKFSSSPKAASMERAMSAYLRLSVNSFLTFQYALEGNSDFEKMAAKNEEKIKGQFNHEMSELWVLVNGNEDHQYLWYGVLNSLQVLSVNRIQNGNANRTAIIPNSKEVEMILNPEEFSDLRSKLRDRPDIVELAKSEKELMAKLTILALFVHNEMVVSSLIQELATAPWEKQQARSQVYSYRQEFEFLKRQMSILSPNDPFIAVAQILDEATKNMTPEQMMNLYKQYDKEIKQEFQNIEIPRQRQRRF